MDQNASRTTGKLKEFQGIIFLVLNKFYSKFSKSAVYFCFQFITILFYSYVLQHKVLVSKTAGPEFVHNLEDGMCGYVQKWLFWHLDILTRSKLALYLVEHELADQHNEDDSFQS